MHSTISRRIMRRETLPPRRAPGVRANCRISPRLAVHVLTAQEAERRRVGREIHDEFGQRLALLQFDIDSLRQQFSSHAPLASGLESLHGSVAVLAKDLHRICERLHPVVLDSLGLVRGIEALCEQQAKVSGMKTVFEHDSIPEQLPVSVSQCLYRVVQEALHNAVKYSGSSEVFVAVRKEGHGIRATVRDTGRGFDRKLRRTSGLGLTSMAERVSQLGGRCRITSAPGKGTCISIWVAFRTPRQ